jgi:hypothetical protein
MVVWLVAASIQADTNSIGTLVDPYTGERVPMLYCKMRSLCSPAQNYGIYIVTAETSKGRWTTGTLTVAGKSFNFPVNSGTVGGTLAAVLVLVCAGLFASRRLRRRQTPQDPGPDSPLGFSD